MYGLQATLLAPLPWASSRFPSPKGVRPQSPALPVRSPFAGKAPDAADRLGLGRDVCEDAPVAIPLESLLDEGPEHDLQTHRELERRRRLSSHHPRPVEDVLGENEQDSGPILEHHTTLISAGRPFAPHARSNRWVHMLYMLYNLYYGQRRVKRKPRTDVARRHPAHRRDRDPEPVLLAPEPPVEMLWK